MAAKLAQERSLSLASTMLVWVTRLSTSAGSSPTCTGKRYGWGESAFGGWLRSSSPRNGANASNGLAERARLIQAIGLVRMAVHSFRKTTYSYGISDCNGSLPDLLLEEAEACLAER